MFGLFTNQLYLNCNVYAGGATVKIEVNGIKRGIIGEVEERNFVRKLKMSSK